MTIPKIHEYYFHEGKYHLKSKFLRNIRVGFIAGLVLGSLFATTSASNFSTVVPNMEYATKDAKYVDYIQSANKKITKKESTEIVKSVMKWSSEFSVDERLILAVMTVESGFDKYAISGAGAMGLMQVMTSVHWNKLKEVKTQTGSPELFGIDSNIYLGTKILRDCMKQFKVAEKSLQCYNGSVGMSNGYDKKVLIAMKEI